MPVDRVVGLEMVVQTLAKKRLIGGYTRPVHYHPRSDLHSNVGSIGMAVDLMLRSDAFVRDVTAGRLVIGVNEVLRDFGTGREKTLDLVIGTPGDHRPSRSGAQDLHELIAQHDVQADRSIRTILDGLPLLPVGPVGQVRVAMEAKACMTAHGKARPRLYDELTSSHATVHGNSPRALSVGLVMVNVAEQFMSPIVSENKNLGPYGTPTMNIHKQPDAALAILNKLSELHIRGGSTDVPGFDGLAVVLVETDNDTSGFALTEHQVSQSLENRFRYSSMIDRVASLYDQFYGSF